MEMALGIKNGVKAPSIHGFIDKCRLKIMTLIFMTGAWYFFMLLSSQTVQDGMGVDVLLYSEAVKLGFAVLFLTVAVVFLYLVWRQEVKQNRNLSEKMVDRTDEHNHNLQLVQESMLKAISDNTETLKSLANTISAIQKARSESERRQEYLLNQIKDKL